MLRIGQPCWAFDFGPRRVEEQQRGNESENVELHGYFANRRICDAMSRNACCNLVGSLEKMNTPCGWLLKVAHVDTWLQGG